VAFPLPSDLFYVATTVPVPGYLPIVPYPGSSLQELRSLSPFSSFPGLFFCQVVSCVIFNAEPTFGVSSLTFSLFFFAYAVFFPAFLFPRSRRQNIEQNQPTNIRILCLAYAVFKALISAPSTPLPLLTPMKVPFIYQSFPHGKIRTVPIPLRPSDFPPLLFFTSPSQHRFLADFWIYLRMVKGPWRHAASPFVCPPPPVNRELSYSIVLARLLFPRVPPSLIVCFECRFTSPTVLPLSKIYCRSKEPRGLKVFWSGNSPL